MNIRESMTKIVTKEGHTIRIWRQEFRYDRIDRTRLLEDVQKITTDDLWATIQRIAKLPNVNAVEGLMEDGNGEILYNDWP